MNEKIKEIKGKEDKEEKESEENKGKEGPWGIRFTEKGKEFIKRFFRI